MKLIGMGSNWNIYELPDGKQVFRISTGSSDYRIRSFIKNHGIVRQLGLPTLSIAEPHQLNNVNGIRCNNLNDGEEIIYITPNSVYPDLNKKADDAMEVLSNITIERKISQAGQYRYLNKLEEIKAFDEFLVIVNAT
jgi:hypothetical protein